MVEENKPAPEVQPAEASSEDASLHDVSFELNRLLDLAVKYPEIGPPLAELAFKLGQHEFGNRVVRMGLEGEGPGLEYYFVAAYAARREQRFEDLRRHAVEAIRAFRSTPPDKLAEDDGERLLHLVRLGYATMMFDEKNVQADPDFIASLAQELPTLEAQLSSGAFFHVLMAQTLWYSDRAASDEAWERARVLGDAEFTFNARGTWHKEAEQDIDKAEQAYRQGLQQASSSPLLLHNLAQVLVDKAERPDVAVEDARRMLREAEQLLRGALREEAPRGLRRYIHSTRDRLNELRSSLPPRTGARAEAEEPAEPEVPPTVGEVLKGTVRSIAPFGAFIAIRGRGVGLLHKTEIAYGPVDDPAAFLKIGEEVEVKVLDVARNESDGKLRIALSRRALLPPPPPAAAPQRREERNDRPPRGGQAPRDRGPRPEGQRQDRPAPGQQQGGGQRGGRPGGRPDKPRDDKFASLGEMLLAKLKEQEKKGQ